MAAPKNNKYWKLRNKHGRDRIYETPEDFANACNRYFAWSMNNPLQEEQIVKGNWTEKDENGKEIEHSYQKVQVSKMRPFTIKALCNHIDMVESTFLEYEKKKDFSNICKRVRQIIFEQKFTGAATGFFNHAIIARDLGLVDKKSVDLEDKRKTVNDLFPTEDEFKEAAEKLKNRKE